MKKRFIYIYVSSFINFSFALTFSSSIYMYNVYWITMLLFSIPITKYANNRLFDDEDKPRSIQLDEIICDNSAQSWNGFAWIARASLENDAIKITGLTSGVRIITCIGTVIRSTRSYPYWNIIDDNKEEKKKDKSTKHRRNIASYTRMSDVLT